MSISNVIIIEDNTTTQGNIKRFEKAFYGIYLEKGDKLILSVRMKGDITLKIYFQNRRLLIKTIRTGNHSIEFMIPADGFYQCIFETIGGANYTLDCDIEESKVKKEAEPSLIERISLKNVVVLLPLFILPSCVLYLFLHKISFLVTIPLFAGIYLSHEIMEEKEIMLYLLYASNVIFALLALFYVYAILGWHDVERLLLVLLYLIAFMLAIATFHLFFKKVMRYET